MQWQDRARRSDPDHLRSQQNFLWATAEDFFQRGARSDAVESPGARRWDPVSIGNLLFGSRAAADCRSLHQTVGASQGLSLADRDRGDAAEGILSGRRIPSE